MLRAAIRRFWSRWRWNRCKSGIHGPFRRTARKMGGAMFETECVVCGSLFTVELYGDETSGNSGA
jgi:hypothetical protein